VKKLTLNEAIELHAAKQLVGVFEMTNQEYHAAPGLSKSALDNINESPFYYKWKLDNPDDLSEALIFGSAYHAKVLEPHLFPILFFPTSTQPRAPKRDALGRAPLSEANSDKIDAMVKRLKSLPGASKLIVGQPELCFFWTDIETGIQCKCKIDVLSPAGVVVDLKTCQDASPKKFSATILDRRYQVQGAWILDGIRKAVEQSGISFPIPDSFILLAQEKSEPFRVAQGEEMYRKDLETYAECVTKNEWPDYPDQVVDIECPIWSFK
jgi:hypothetical protein